MVVLSYILFCQTAHMYMLYAAMVLKYIAYYNNKKNILACFCHVILYHNDSITMFYAIIIVIIIIRRRIFVHSRSIPRKKHNI